MMPAPVRSRSSLTASAVIRHRRDAPVSCGARPGRARDGSSGPARRRRRCRPPARVHGRRREPGRDQPAAGSAAGASASAAALGAPGRRSSSSSPGRTRGSPPAASCGDQLVRRRPRTRAPGPPAARGLGLGRRTGGALSGALDRRVRDQLAEQPDRADRVVVGRDDVVELVRVDVGVAGADDRDLELVRLGDGDPLAVRVDDEDRRRAGASSCGCRRAWPGACSAPRSAARPPSSAAGRSRRPAGAPRAGRGGRCASGS